MPDLQILSLQLIDFSLKVLHLLLLFFDVFLLFLEHGIIGNSITPHLLDLLRNLDQLLLLNLQVPLKLVCAVGRQLPLESISLGGQSVDLGGRFQQLGPQLFNQISEFLITFLGFRNIELAPNMGVLGPWNLLANIFDVEFLFDGCELSVLLPLCLILLGHPIDLFLKLVIDCGR